MNVYMQFSAKVMKMYKIGSMKMEKFLYKLQNSNAKRNVGQDLGQRTSEYSEFESR